MKRAPGLYISHGKSDHHVLFCRAFGTRLDDHMNSARFEHLSERFEIVWHSIYGYIVNYSEYYKQSWIIAHINLNFMGFFMHTYNFNYWAAVIWLKYCRYGLKHYPINQLINQIIASSKLFKQKTRGRKASWIKAKKEVCFEFDLILNRTVAVA